jgi:phosphatidylinositol alpha-1,6-mannosyltransferase
MRILIYTHEFAPWSGGIATYNSELASGLATQGHDILVLAPRYSGGNDVEQKKEKYRIRRPFPDEGFKPYKLVVSTLSLIWAWLKFRPDAIMATNGGSQRCAALASLLFPIPLVLVVHGKEIRGLFKNERPLIRGLRPLLCEGFRHARIVIAVSEATREILLSAMPELSDKTHVVHFGIDSPSWSLIGEQQIGALRKNLNLTREDKVLLTVARLTPGKGHDYVIQSLPKVLEEVPDAKYLVVGDGESAEELKSLVQTMGVEPSIRFVGNVPREQVWAYYQLCDVFVMPSRLNENFGLVFLEAASMGKPTIGGNRAGMKEAVLAGETGILVDPDSVEEIASAIIYLLTHPEVVSQMGQRGYERFEKHFSVQAMVEKTLSVLGQMFDVN